MGWGNRVLKGAGQYAEGDKNFVEAIFNGASGTLFPGYPVYKDVTDAAEFNAQFAATALSPAVNPTGGNVLLSTAANVGANPIALGIFQPLGLQNKPNNGDVIRIQTSGSAVVYSQSPTGGSAATVGGIFITSTAVAAPVPGAAAVTKTLGIYLATGTHVAAGATIFAAASATLTYVNAFIALD